MPSKVIKLIHDSKVLKNNPLRDPHKRELLVYLPKSYIDSGKSYPVVYLIAITNDRTGDPNQPDAGSRTLAEDLRKEIASALSDLPARIAWVATLDEVPKDAQAGTVQEGGLAITFGNIQFQRDGSVQLAASAYISGMIGGGQTYILEKVDGKWQVTGFSGTKWIS